MSEALVTVAMPVRNCKKTLSAAVQSILCQTFEDWQLVVIDDGSTDDTLSSLEPFSDSRIRVRNYHQQKGLSARLNEIISGCHTEYFARMDGDDVSYPQRLERQLEYLEAHRDVNLVGAGVLVFGNKGQVIGKRPAPEGHENICAKPHAGFRIAHPTYLGKTNWFRRFGYEERFLRSQDQDLLLRSFRASRFANVPEILLGYREPAIRPGKTLRSRVLFAKILLRHYQREHNLLLGLWGAFGQVLRGQLDLLTVLTGLNHTTLTHRATPASPAERSEWKRIWRMVNAANPRPVRSQVRRRIPAVGSPRVTIGLPFYNPGRLLQDAIRSVFSQTFKDWELILLDDGSTDGSGEFVQQIADPRVQVYSDGKNLGLSARLNQISDMARGDYLVRMDADDMMAPTRLEEQVSFLAANPELDVVGTQAFVLDENRVVVGSRRIDPHRFLDPKRCLRHGMVIHPTIMAHREWFRENKYDSAYPRAEDRELFARVIERGAIAQLNKLLYFYYVPSEVRIRAFLEGYRSERVVMRRYGPDLVGRFRTAALLSNSFIRSALLPILITSGLQTRIARRLQGKGKLSREEAAAGAAILNEICRTPIPMCA